MSYRQYDLVGTYLISSVGILDRHTCDMHVHTGICYDIRHFAVKSEFRTVKAHIFTHISDNVDEYVRTHMRFGVIEDVYRCTEHHEGFQHKPASSGFIIYKRIKLTVRKSACSSFSELNIRFGIENTVFPEFIHINSATVYIRATLDNDGA